MSENTVNTNVPAEENLGEQIRIRRQKLSELQAAGADPFVISKFDPIPILLYTNSTTMSIHMNK